MGDAAACWGDADQTSVTVVLLAHPQATADIPTTALKRSPPRVRMALTSYKRTEQLGCQLASPHGALGHHR